MITPLLQTSSDRSENLLCPETHYQCPDAGYCLPVFTRCNGVSDCPNHEDERDCQRYQCPGYHRCYRSRVCLHASHICDGIYHCPRQDDELLCSMVCPPQCTCHGLAFTCPQYFEAHLYPDLRYLNARGSGLVLTALSRNTLLVYLSLANCGLHTVVNVSLPNAQTIDISNNKLAVLPVGFLDGAHNLKTLFLSGNFISYTIQDTRKTLKSILALDLSFNTVHSVADQFLQVFSSLEFLNLSQCGISEVKGRGFQGLKNLRVLDMKGCPMTEIAATLLSGLSSLRAVHSDNYKLCCAAALSQNFETKNCYAPRDEISSCQDLLRSNVYRIFIAIFISLALVGNIGSFLFRIAALLKDGEVSGYTVFVLHLCMADFFMGVYLTVIGIADKLYENVYIWHEIAWKTSHTCKFAGSLSFLSCEVSAFMVSLITLDRLLVVRFPLSFLRFSKRHAIIASCVSWSVGLGLSALPLMPGLHHWQFYSQTSICIPLPVTRVSFPGKDFSFAVMVVLNFILFLAIGVGQLLIYQSIRANTMSSSHSGQQSKDMDIARRLFTIALTNFTCWFPIGLFGILTSCDVPVPGEVSVALAVFVMPLNSAINPFLYTLNIILEKRRRKKEERLLAWIKNQN